MATVDQCTEAIKNVNGFRIGNDRLIVEFAKSQEEKDRDRREKEVCYYESVNAMRFVHFAPNLTNPRPLPQKSEPQPENPIPQNP